MREDLVIRLVRHGESHANVKEVDPQTHGDHRIDLTPTGIEQARCVGKELGREAITGGIVYCSPYQRTRQTLNEILRGAKCDRSEVRALEDPRLREVEHGYGPDVEQQKATLRRTHGYFYYRFSGGESPADCFDRTSSFLETLMRQVERKDASNVLVVTHGLTIRCFVMRFLHLTVEQFDMMENPDNCAVITIGASLKSPQFRSGRWGVLGLELSELR